MVRLADLPDWERQHMLSKVKDCAGFDGRPWVKPPALDKCRVAIISTAGLHARGGLIAAVCSRTSDICVVAIPSVSR